MKKKIKHIHKLKKQNISWRFLWENFVFKHQDHYYKMPTFLARNIVYRSVDSRKKVQDNFKTIKKYFWSLTRIPETQFLKDTNGHYIIKQKDIHWEKLSKKLLENNPKLVSKFQRLIIANEIMWRKEWVFLDLLGSDIIAHPNTIHNLLTDGENIYVFDFWLLEKTSNNLFFRYFSYFWTWFQLKFVKIFF